jgi:hypothetical protein
MTRRTAIASAPRPVNTKYGQRMVIDCRLDDGETVTIWKSADDQVCRHIANGERIQLEVLPSGRTGSTHYYKIVETAQMRAVAIQADLAAVDAAVAARLELCKELGF